MNGQGRAPRREQLARRARPDRGRESSGAARVPTDDRVTEVDLDPRLRGGGKVKAGVVKE